MESDDSSSLQQSSLLEQLVECSPNGIIVVDMNQIVGIVNPTTKTLLPLIHDPIGKPLKDVFPVPPLSVEKTLKVMVCSVDLFMVLERFFLGVFPYQNKSGSCLSKM